MTAAQEVPAGTSVPVALSSRFDPPKEAGRLPEPPRSQHSQLRISRLFSNSERMRLAVFFARLAVKEHFAPQLHVRPLVAELFLTDNCNLRCVTCSCWRENTRRELSSEEWRSVIDQLVGVGIVKLNFTGGEPLLRKDSIDLIAYARSRGIRSLHLNTNGLLLTAARRERVLTAGVRSFNISIDGADPALHDLIRGVSGAFDTTMANLRALLSERERYRLRVRLSFTVQRRNARFLPDIGRLAQDLGVQLYLNVATDTTFLFRHPAVSEETNPDDRELRRALEEMEALARRDASWLPRFSDRRYVADHFSDRLQSALPCAESQLKLMVHSTGEVGGCWAHDARDNVRERPIAEIIADDHYRDEHARFFQKDCVGCGSNYSLNLRWRPRTYVADGMHRVRSHLRFLGSP